MTNEIQNNKDENSSESSLEDTLLKLKPYIQKLKASWKKLFIFNAIVGVIAVLYLLFIVKPYFRSSVVILPEYGNGALSMLGNLSGLASMAGISLGKGSPTQIYEALLTSEKVISEAVYKKYKTEEYEDSVNLIEYFEIKPKENLNEELQKRDQFLKLYKQMTKGRITTGVDRMTRILTVTVEMPEAELSANVANTLIKSLDDYVKTDRQSFAIEQREYLEIRLKQVTDTLNLFENELKIFREKNRAVSNSPQLLLEQTRLMRKVELSQAVYLELYKQYEIIKLQEVKDTPVLNVMETAQTPIKKAGPKRTISLIVIMFFSGIFSVAYILFRSEVVKYWRMVKS